MLDKELAKKIRYIQIYTSKAVNDILAGEYHSVFKGSGMEFEEVRQYAPGDEIRSIDWNVTARAGEPYIKRYIEERDMRVMFLVDVSASNILGTAKQSKTELAAELTSLLAFSAIKNNDRVGLVAFSDEIEHYIPPKKGTPHVLRLVREILSLKPKGRRTDIKNALEYLAKITTKRCVVFLISDFFDEGYDKQLRILSKKHDVVAISLTDKLEKELPKAGIFLARDAESGEQIWVDSSSKKVREGYAKQSKIRELKLRDKMRSLKVDHIPLTTGEDYLKGLMRFFRMRESRKQQD